MNDLLAILLNPLCRKSAYCRKGKKYPEEFLDVTHSVSDDASEIVYEFNKPYPFNAVLMTYVIDYMIVNFSSDYDISAIELGPVYFGIAMRMFTHPNMWYEDYCKRVALTGKDAKWAFYLTSKNKNDPVLVIKGSA